MNKICLDCLDVGINDVEKISLCVGEEEKEKRRWWWREGRREDVW